MGEGLYRSPDGRTAYAEPFEDIDDALARSDAYDAFVTVLHDCLSDAWEPVEHNWRGRTERVVARNGLHEVWVTQDDYDRLHVTFGVRRDLDETEALARATTDDRAEAFFDRLQATYELRVRTTPWTSAARQPRRIPA